MRKARAAAKEGNELLDRLLQRAYTSRQASEISGVPFFTVDYWDRSKFLEPTVAKGNGRGKGRQRMYSYADILRLRIARDMREQGVSLSTLRLIVDRLAGVAADLPSASFVVVGAKVATARDIAALSRILERGHSTFGVLLDLRGLRTALEERAARHVTFEETY